MHTIYKYPLVNTMVQVILLPEDAGILNIEYQYGALQLWAGINTDNPLVEHVIHMYGTGLEIPELPISRELVYINTVFLDQKSFVFHFFEEVDVEETTHH